MLAATDGSPDLTRLSQLRMSLKEKLKEIKALDSEILGMVGDKELDEEVAQADLYKERIFTALILIEKATTPTSLTSAVITSPGTPTPTTTSPPGNKVRLPKLTIKPFSGKLTAWTPFWDAFRSAIHENPDISKVDKFNYLRSLVTHSALEAISGLTLSSANYDEAVEIVRKRLGNKQLIIGKHMEQLLSIYVVSSQHDVKGIRRLYDVIESNVRSLKSLDVHPESYGSLLTSVLMNKLPAELRLIASCKFGDTDSWDLTALLKVVEEEVEAREGLIMRTAHESRRPPKEQPTAVMLFADTMSPRCCFCQQEHPAQDCRTIAEIDSHREILRKSGRCYICLQRGHISRNCHSAIKCRGCRGRHHVAICPNISIPPPGDVRPRAGDSRPQSGDSEASCGHQAPSTLIPMLHPISPHEPVPYGHTLVNTSFFRQHKLCSLTPINLPRRGPLESY